MNFLFVLISFRLMLAYAVEALHGSSEVGQSDDVGFMQLDQRVDKQAANSSGQHAQRTVNPQLSTMRPVIWLHIPKCGTGLFLSFVRLPHLCDHDTTFAEWTEARSPQLEAAYVKEHCPGSFSMPQVYDDKTQIHVTLMGDMSAYNNLYLGHTFSMFRQPEQRIISEYLYDERQLKSEIRKALFSDWTTKPSLLAYAHIAQGVSVKMITRFGSMSEWLPGPVTAAETQLAVSRVEEAFKYIGITDQWDLSMCLLHAMFGGKCVASDFANSRPGPNNSADPYDTAGLEGFVDIHDGAVYAEAIRIFDERLATYQVSMASCNACFSEAAADADAAGLPNPFQ